MMMDLGGNQMILEHRKTGPALCLSQMFTPDNRNVLMFVESSEKFECANDAVAYCKMNDLQLIKWPFEPEDFLKMKIDFGA